MASSWWKRPDNLAFSTASFLLCDRYRYRYPHRARSSSSSTRNSRCFRMRSEAADAVGVQLAKSRRFRRSGDTVSARKALDVVRRTDKDTSEYILEDANVRASELLTSGNPEMLLKGASSMLDSFDRVSSNSHSPSAIAAALRVVRTAAESSPALKGHSKHLTNRAFDLLLLSQPSSNGRDHIPELNAAMQSLISVCATIGDPDAADDFLNTIKRKYPSYEPCAKVRASLLLANIVAGRVNEATRITADIEARNEVVPPTTIASLASAYADAGRHVLAVSALDEALTRYGAFAVSQNHTLLAAVLRSCERSRDARAARRVYDALVECDATPPAHIIRALLRAAFKGGEALLAEAILLDGRNDIAANYRLGPDDMNRMVAAASRIPALPPKKKAAEAMRLFERTSDMRICDLGAFNVLVAALARVGALADAKYIVQHKMREYNIVPNIVTFNTLLHACVVASRPYIALEIWRGMMVDYVAPNQVTYNTLVNLAAESGTRELLDAVLYEMRANPSVELDPTAVAAILKFYRRVRDPDGARQVVGILQKAQRQRRIDIPLKNRRHQQYLPLDPVVYVSLLTIYVECERHSDAITLFGLLVVRRIGGSRPYNVMMHYQAAKKGDAKRALMILAAMKRRGIAPDASSYTIAIRAAAGAHRLSLAQRLLAEMQDVGAAAADTYAWTAVIAACGRAGRPQEALELLAKMREGVPGAPRPDIAAYNAAIYAVGMASRESGWRACLTLYGLAKDDKNANLDDVTYSALASVALRHRHNVREEDVLKEIERALQKRLGRLRKENEARLKASSKKNNNQRSDARRKSGPPRRSPGTGEAKKLAAKLKRIRWLITNMENEREGSTGSAGE